MLLVNSSLSRSYNIIAAAAVKKHMYNEAVKARVPERHAPRKPNFTYTYITNFGHYESISRAREIVYSATGEINSSAIQNAILRNSRPNCAYNRKF